MNEHVANYKGRNCHSSAATNIFKHFKTQTIVCWISRTATLSSPAQFNRLMIGQAFGNVLRTLRKERKVTQVLLAEYTELEPNYISMLERGLRQPTLTTIFKIGTALKIAPSEIVKQVESTIPWRKE